MEVGRGTEDNSPIGCCVRIVHVHCWLERLVRSTAMGRPVRIFANYYSWRLIVSWVDSVDRSTELYGNGGP